ncbi:MAG: cytochrome-c peroxidase, partial [Pseudomonadota bacterium]
QALDNIWIQERLRARVDIQPVQLNDTEIAQLVEFLHALGGKESRHGRLKIPNNVPSGLEVTQ